MMQKQQGMTLVGMLFTATVVVMAAIIVMRVVPVYLQHYTITQSVKSLSTVPVDSLTGDPVTDVAVMKGDLDKRLNINSIDELKENDVVIVPKDEHRFQVTVKYQVIRPLGFNISLLFDFNDTYEVVAGSEN